MIQYLEERDTTRNEWLGSYLMLIFCRSLFLSMIINHRKQLSLEIVHELRHGHRVRLFCDNGIYLRYNPITEKTLQCGEGVKNCSTLLGP